MRSIAKSHTILNAKRYRKRWTSNSLKSESNEQFLKQAVDKKYGGMMYMGYRKSDTELQMLQNVSQQQQPLLLLLPAAKTTTDVDDL